MNPVVDADDTWPERVLFGSSADAHSVLQQRTSDKYPDCRMGALDQMP